MDTGPTPVAYTGPSRRLRMAVRLTLGQQPLPVHDVPLFILLSPPKAQVPCSLPFWAVRGDVSKWWNALTWPTGVFTVTITRGGARHA